MLSPLSPRHPPSPDQLYLLKSVSEKNHHNNGDYLVSMNFDEDRRISDQLSSLLKDKVEGDDFHHISILVIPYTFVGTNPYLTSDLEVYTFDSSFSLTSRNPYQTYEIISIPVQYGLSPFDCIKTFNTNDFYFLGENYQVICENGIPMRIQGIEEEIAEYLSKISNFKFLSIYLVKNNDGNICYWRWSRHNVDEMFIKDIE